MFIQIYAILVVSVHIPTRREHLARPIVNRIWMQKQDTRNSNHFHLKLEASPTRLFYHLQCVGYLNQEKRNEYKHPLITRYVGDPKRAQPLHKDHAILSEHHFHVGEAASIH
jgi:hypothetical protein